MEHEELSNLREAYYRTQNSIPEENDDLSIEFPYSVGENVCVFGGHDSWMKAIRPLLPNVKFISRFVTPHPDLIKNSDVIWLQTNSMSHVYFDQVITVARKHDKVCKYFLYSSARKCAEQIVDYSVTLM